MNLMKNFKPVRAVMIAVVAAALWLPSTAFSVAEPADENWGARIRDDFHRRGTLSLIYAGLVCSNAAAADTTCSVWDFGDLASRGQGDVIVLSILEDNNGVECTPLGGGGSTERRCVKETGTTAGCTTPSATFKTGPIRTAGSDLTPTGARAVAASPTITSAATGDGTTHALTLNTADTPMSRYLFTTLSDMTSCESVDVVIEIYERTR